MIEHEEFELFGQSLHHAMQDQTGAALDGVLRQLGWQDALSADARAAVSLLFEPQGETNNVSSALDWVLAHALGQEATAVVLPALGHWSAPGALAGRELDVRGIATASLSGHQTTLIAARAGGSHVVVEVDTAALPRRPIGGVDPALGLVEITGRVDGARDLGVVDWPAVVASGQRALGHELVGSSRQMLALAREHALARVQFGRPIAAFQAVRHRLAETLVGIEAAAAVLDAAWLDRVPQTARMAKATAGRAARVSARHCQQVLAGIGFTAEHPFHRYVRRILVLEQLLGSTRALTRELGSEILQHRLLPALLPL